MIRSLAIAAIGLCLSACTQTTQPFFAYNTPYAVQPQVIPTTLQNGVIPREDYWVEFPKEDALEAYSLASYIAQNCNRYGVDELKLFHFFKAYDLLPDDVRDGGRVYDGFRDGYDLFDFQSRRPEIGNQSCSVGDRLHNQNRFNPGWILKAG